MMPTIKSTTLKGKITPITNYAPYVYAVDYFKKVYLYGIKKYIINDGATIIFWDDDTKTVSKRHEEDEFDKELGFLFAYFYKKSGLSKSATRRVIDTIKYDKIKVFLFEFFVNNTKQTYSQARGYLKNLKVS